MAMHAAEPSRSRISGRLSVALASVIFPSDCRTCESLLTTASRLPICDDCLASFRRNPLESCDVCGVPWGVPGESDEGFAICPESREHKYGFERTRGPARWWKYERIEPLGRWFAERLLEVIRADEKAFVGRHGGTRAVAQAEKERTSSTRWNCSRGRWRGAWGSRTGRCC
jgi:hypothetical protein